MYMLDNPAFYSDADLTNIIRKAVYMSSAEGNKNLNHHQLYHDHSNTALPSLPALPPFTVNQNQQRLRNEMIISAATLPSIMNTRKRPLSHFWEMHLHDTDTDTHTKNRKTILYLTILVTCLVIIVIGISVLTYLMLSKNMNFGWDKSYTGDEKQANTDSVKQEHERDERGSKIIFGEFRISNRVFTDALTVWSTQEFETLANEVTKSMDDIFTESPLARVYNMTQMSSFSKSEKSGVIAKCVITLNIALLTAAQEVGLTFIKALENGHGRLPGAKLRVDIRTIKFTGVRQWIAKLEYDNTKHVNVSEMHIKSGLSDKALLSLKEWQHIRTHTRTQYVISNVAVSPSPVMIRGRSHSHSDSRSQYHSQYRTKRNIGDRHTAAISSNRIANNIHYARDNKDALNLELGRTMSYKDNDTANDFANSAQNVFATSVPSFQIFNDAFLLEAHNLMHVNAKDAQFKRNNKTINDYLPKISNNYWELNESLRSLFIALSGTVPPMIAPNPGYSETHSTSIANEREIMSRMKAEWSNWSDWSPCRGVNTKCDSGRIHSRIRKCVSENGDIVNSDICRMNNGEQQELEIRDCRCDEESVRSAHYGYGSDGSVGSVGSDNINNNMTTITSEVSHSSNIEQSDRACNDCKENEICLLQVKAAVPFCAKIKDPRDPRGCGGWCSGHKELCRYVGADTYQCVDDSECLEGEWQCANGLCIPHSRRCDGHFNCFDMSDELHCDCRDDEFHCGNKTSCLPISQKCDGIIHCWDGEDEQNCTKLCTENQFTCNTGGQCIPLDYFCDGRYKHCEDGSDEPDGCNITCEANERQCKNGRCVSDTVFCDGINNCDDNSDEIDCQQTTFRNNTGVRVLATNKSETSATLTTSERSKQLFFNTTVATETSSYPKANKRTKRQTNIHSSTRTEINSSKMINK